MKIYAVTSGSYSDYGIDQLFLTREKALAYIKSREAENRWEHYRIEAYDTYDDCIEVADGYLDNVYAALVVYCDLKNGGSWYVERFGQCVSYEYKHPDIFENRNRRDGGLSSIRVELTVKPQLTDDQIIKIAQDEYAKWKAEREE